jgi:hypothetical protein
MEARFIMVMHVAVSPFDDTDDLAFDRFGSREFGWDVLRYPSFSFNYCVSTGRIISDLSKQAHLFSDETDTIKETSGESCRRKSSSKSRLEKYFLHFFLSLSCS